MMWNPVDGAEDYRVQLASDRDFKEGLIEDRTPIPRYVAGRGLAPGTYYWRVAAVVGGKPGAYSSAASFTVQSHEKVFNVPADADLATIQRIVREAASRAPARVVFAEGAHYRVIPERRLFNLSGVTDLELDGNGATFVIGNYSAGFIHLNRCQRVTVRNFAIDFDPLPFSVGTVQEVDLADGTFTLQADAGMAEFDAPHMLEGWEFGVILDAGTPGRMKSGTSLVIPAKAPPVREGNLVRIALPDKERLATLAPGDKFVQFARKGGASLFGSEDSDELAFLDNTTYAAPGLHYSLLQCSDAKLLGGRSIMRPGRWFGGNADGVHVRSSRIGPWIEGCTFEGIGDDAVAIYSKGIVILDKPSDTTLRLDKGFFNLEPGSSFLIFDPVTGAPLAENLTVQTVSDVPENGEFPAHKLVEFSPGFSADISTDFTQAPAGNDGTTREYLEQRIKDGWRHLQVFNRSAQHDRFMIRRNVLKQIRRFGAIIRAENGAVEDNEFVQTSSSAVILRNEPYFWRNGLQSENILIQNNTIRDCNFSTTTSSVLPGSIAVLLHRASSEAGLRKDEPTEWRGHRDIRIRGNSISEWRSNAIWVQSAEDVEIIGNRIDEPLPSEAGTDRYAIYLENVSNAEVSGNSIAPSPLLTGEMREVDCHEVAVKP